MFKISSNAWIYLLKDIGINSTKLYKERQEQICLIKRFNRLNFVIGLNETKESWPNSFRNQIEQGIKGKLLKILVKFGLGFHLHKY